MINESTRAATLTPRFEERPAELAIGLADSFAPNSFELISNLWNIFQNRMHEIQNVKPGYALGVCLASHPDVQAKANSTFVYASALPVLSAESIPEGMLRLQIPSGKYVVFTHTGNLNTLPATINYIWNKWIPQNMPDYKHPNGPDFELYDSRFDPSSKSGQMEIWVPVSK